MKKTSNFLLASSLSILIGGCGAKLEQHEDLNKRPQNYVGWNGVGWNGVGWNGVGWNGIGWNGVGWNGIGWNSVSWSGIGWTGTIFTNPGMTADWGLDTWINDPSIPVSEREARMMGIEYWASCACDQTDHLPWSGTDPTSGLPTTKTIHGALGVAPTWCHSSAPVPTSELEAVSACLLSRINNQGIHNALSIRGYDSTLKLSDNEKLFMAYPEGQLWANLWDSSVSFQDPVSGLFYKNERAYACHFPQTGTTTAQLLKDLGTIIGRTCEIDGCGGVAHTALSCFQDGNADGAKSMAYADAALTIPIGYTIDPATTTAGPSNSVSNGYQDWLTGTTGAVHYNNAKRRMSVFLGAWADLETGNWKDPGYRCDSGCGPLFDGCACYEHYCSSSFEGGGGGQVCESPSYCNNCQTVVRHPGPGCWGTDATCLANDCVRNHKLTSLAPGCWLPIQFTRPHDLLTGALVSGVANQHKAGTLVFRYAHLGPGPAGILLQDMIRGVPIAGGTFAPTGSHNIYADKLIYPIYPGRSVFTGALPGIEISLAADPAHAFPELDYAQIHVGPPFGQSPRELYWQIGTIDFKPGDTVCQSITVDNDTDFANAGDIRIRPDIAGPAAYNLDITVSHNGVLASYAHDADDSPWSKWISTFQSDVPNNGTWEVCINHANDYGSFLGASLELKQP